MSTICPDCDGSGYDDRTRKTLNKQTCKTCKGTGELPAALDKTEAERRYPDQHSDLTYPLDALRGAARSAFLDGIKFSKERAAREQQHAICPECLGERRIKGALCPRCHGSAQIHRSKLRDGEVAPFERVALAATADVKEAAELRYPSDGTAWPISYHELIPEQRAAFDAGARWAAERAALAASGTAAGVGEAEVNLDSIARRCARGVRECATDLQYGDLVDRIKEALQAASGPAAGVGEDIELRNLACDCIAAGYVPASIVEGCDYPGMTDNQKVIDAIIALIQKERRALASEAGPAGSEP